MFQEQQYCLHPLEAQRVQTISFSQLPFASGSMIDIRELLPHLSSLRMRSTLGVHLVHLTAKFATCASLHLQSDCFIACKCNQRTAVQVPSG